VPNPARQARHAGRPVCNGRSRLVDAMAYWFAVAGGGEEPAGGSGGAATTTESSTESLPTTTEPAPTTTTTAAPKPKPTPKPKPKPRPVLPKPVPKPKPAPKPASTCDPNYTGCVPVASDVDCAGGSGNGPAYLQGTVEVVGTDVYDLDRDGDGTACE
jgi:hypothetical protein